MKLKADMYANPVYNSASPFERDLSRLNPTEQSFSTLADGGFGGGSLSFENVPTSLIEEFLNNNQMKRVTLTDAGGQVAYEGFIAEINAVTKHHDYTWSIDPFFNRAVVTYNSAGAACPGGGGCTTQEYVPETDIDAAYDSRTRFGTKEEWIDYGDDLTTTALANRKGKQIMSRVLKPLMAHVNLGKGSEAQNNALSLTLWSAWSTLSFRKTQRSAGNATEIRTLIVNALGEGKTPYLDISDLSRLVTTGQTMPYNTSKEWMTYQDFIAGLIVNGDSTGKRVFFQIVEGRVPTMFVRSTSPLYYSTSNEWRIFNSDKGAVSPWMVRAGGYLLADDFTASIDEANDVLARPRASLIEETTWDDIAETLDIPPPSELADTRRLHARLYKSTRNLKYMSGHK